MSSLSLDVNQESFQPSIPVIKCLFFSKSRDNQIFCSVCTFHSLRLPLVSEVDNLKKKHCSYCLFIN